jgi:hypothetical protein
MHILEIVSNKKQVLFRLRNLDQVIPIFGQLNPLFEKDLAMAEGVAHIHEIEISHIFCQIRRGKIIILKILLSSEIFFGHLKKLL